MIKLNVLQRNILKSLIKSHGTLDSYTLFKRMKVSISEMSNSITYLINHELVSEDEHIIKITKKGISSVYIESSNSSEKVKEWREIPEELNLDSLGINEPYIPSARILDNKTFKLNENEVN